MPESKTTQFNGSPMRKKKPSLSQQVKEQAEQIKQLTILLQQKEQELEHLTQQDSLIDDLTQKLNQSDQSIIAANKLVSEQAKKIDKLTTTQKREKERDMTTAAEQAELIDGLTTKLLEVDIKLSAASMQNKHVVAKNIVKSHMIAGMALGMVPAPLFDIAALTATELNMLRTLSKHYDIDFDEQKSKVLVTSLLSGSLPVLTVLSLSSVAKLIPGIGTFAGGMSMTVLAGAVTYATGQVFIRHFDLGGTLEDFDSQYWQTYFKQELEEGKSFVKNQLKKNKTPNE
ncbi:MAG: Unknown protein [uncultured Thiotrichaceae bacterium]|uniref:GTPase n=1 Tax=uncultured Thiotrichaceae bacterium TaxID=298394 RepID=A0A6S6UBU5_9GAMM|nr:MAG: Unknown protein [uncultured Thiotrichaceae bacterium]